MESIATQKLAEKITTLHSLEGICPCVRGRILRLEEIYYTWGKEH